MSVTEAIQNVAILIAFLAVVYVVARVLTRFGDAASARKLAPLAAIVDGHTDSKSGALYGTFHGRKIIATFSPNESAGTGDTATSINAFHVRVLNLPGRTEWWLAFHVSGAFGQGPKQLVVSARESTLAERLHASGIVKAIENVNARNATYVAVRFEPFYNQLTYTDDVAPRKIPTVESFKRQLEMAVRIAAVNDQVNA